MTDNKEAPARIAREPRNPVVSIHHMVVGEKFLYLVHRDEKLHSIGEEHPAHHRPPMDRIRHAGKHVVIMPEDECSAARVAKPD